MGKENSPAGERSNTQCAKCPAKCCRYFALEIDTPRTKEDFEKIRWYLAHKKVTVFIDKRKWFLNVENECRYLTKTYGCAIYSKRPLICREHSASDCERNSIDFGHEMVFRSIEELDAYIDRRFRKRRVS